MQQNSHIWYKFLATDCVYIKPNTCSHHDAHFGSYKMWEVLDRGHSGYQIANHTTLFCLFGLNKTLSPSKICRNKRKCRHKQVIVGI